MIFDDSQPIFLQVAQLIQDDILNGTYEEDKQIMSVAQFASTFEINPATVVKGIGLLVNEGILYKKRGLGMYVSKGARKIVLDKRRVLFYNELILNLLEEAEKLELSTTEVIAMITQGKEEGRK